MTGGDLRPFPIVNDWARGCFLARVIGPHSKYVFDREFETGKPVKTRHTVEYEPGRDLDTDTLPAWYVMRDRVRSDQLLEVTATGWRVIASGLNAAEVLAVHEAGPPGSETAFTGERCGQCQAPLCGPLIGSETGTVCSGCEAVNADRAAAPDEVPF